MEKLLPDSFTKSLTELYPNWLRGMSVYVDGGFLKLSKSRN